MRVHVFGPESRIQILKGGIRRKGRKRRRFGAIVGGLAGLAAGAVGAALLLRGKGTVKEGKSLYPEYNRRGADRWARPGMNVTFRAQLMPGRSRSERTFRVAQVMPSGRVMLEDFTGEHTETEFEAIR